jgi:hypothetical protein
VTRALVALAVALLAGRDAAAEPVHRVEAGVGFDHGVVGQVGYRYDRARLSIYAELALPPTGLDLGEHRERVGVRGEVVRRGHLVIDAGAGAGATAAANPAFEGVTLGVHGTLAAGWRSKRAALLAELEVDRGVATYLEHGAWYRTTFWPEARDGWYAATAGTLRAGIGAGAALGTYEVTAHAGVEDDGWLYLYVPPVYARLGVARRF